MTTRRLELVTETLAHDLGELWEAENELVRAKSDHERAVNAHQTALENAHNSMAEFKEAEAEWQIELGPVKQETGARGSWEDLAP